MEDITITIKAPITEHCKKCSYEASRSFYRYRHKCPECGESVSKGRRKHKFVRAWSHTGRYNLMSDDKQTQYFIFVPDQKTYSFVVCEDDLDVSCPFTLVDELKAIYENYTYASKLKDINTLYEIFSDDKYRTEQELMRNKERLIDIQEEYLKVNNQIISLEEEIEELNNVN